MWLAKQKPAPDFYSCHKYCQCACAMCVCHIYIFVKVVCVRVCICICASSRPTAVAALHVAYEQLFQVFCYVAGFLGVEHIVNTYSGYADFVELTNSSIEVHFQYIPFSIFISRYPLSVMQ